MIGAPPSGTPIPWVRLNDSANNWRQISFRPDQSSLTGVGGAVPVVSCQWRFRQATFGKYNGAKAWRVVTLVSGSTSYETYNAGTVCATTPLVPGAAWNQPIPFWSTSNPTYGPVSYAPTFAFMLWRDSSHAYGYIDEGYAPDGLNSYVADVRVRWHCPGYAQDIVAEYRVSGTGSQSPSVSNIFWQDDAPA